MFNKRQVGRKIWDRNQKWHKCIEQNVIVLNIRDVCPICNSDSISYFLLFVTFATIPVFIPNVMHLLFIVVIYSWNCLYIFSQLPCTYFIPQASYSLMFVRWRQAFMAKSDLNKQSHKKCRVVKNIVLSDEWTFTVRWVRLTGKIVFTRKMKVLMMIMLVRCWVMEI